MKLSILIAAYNVELFIEQCVKSCFDKDLENEYEIIVVNDGSTDSTDEIVKILLSEISNLKLITKKNEGLGAARNTGIQEAKGDYVWMIDGDDFIDTKYITYLFLELNKKDAYDMYMHNYVVSNIDDEKLGIGYDIPPFSGIINGGQFYKNLFEKGFTFQFIFRKRIFINNEISFMERINMQDSEILPRILYFVKTIKYNNFLAYFYIQHANSFTNNQCGEKRYFYFKSIIEVRNRLQSFSEDVKGDNPDLYMGIVNKKKSINEIIFNHLLFHRYSNFWFNRNITLLRENKLYPLKYSPRGKLKVVKFCFNHFPQLSNWLINRIT